MRYTIIADIHANLEAFTAVLEDINERGGVDEVWCLGDVVGYGPDPHRCIELLRQQNHVCVAGNHDWGAIGKLPAAHFNPDAAAAIRCTTGQLTPEDVEYITNLPLVVEKDDFTMVHGSPREPVREYLRSTSNARENFSYFKSKYCLAGHVHEPMVFRYADTGECSSSRFSPDIRLVLSKSRLIINPGGVGQPRDGDPRASYAIGDSDASTIRLYRVAYDISTTQSKMVKQGLPMRLVSRLKYGF